MKYDDYDQITPTDKGKLNPFIIKEILFFACTLTIGLLLVNFSEKGPLNNKIGAEILFTAGFVKIYGVLLSLIESESIIGQANPNNGIAILMLIAAIIMNSNPDDGWMASIGMPLLEAGMIYVIYRLLFIKESDASQIEKLTKEVSQLKQSVTIGLADTYFWNFVYKVAFILKHYNTQAEYKIASLDKNSEYVTLKTMRLHIFVPQSLDVVVSDPNASEVGDMLRELKIKRNFVEGLIKPFSSAERPMFIKFITQSTDLKELDGLFDMPTSLNILLQNVRNRSEDNIERIDIIQNEIQQFIHRLIQLVTENGFEKYVKIITLKNLKDYTRVNAQIRKAYKE